MSRAFDRNGLAHNDSRDLDWFGLEMPYVQYEGVVLSLYCSSLGAQSCRGAYKPSSSEGMVLYLSYVWWIPLLYFKVGPLFTHFYCDVLVRPGVLRLCQSAGPMPMVGHGEVAFGWISWAMGHCAVVPSRSIGMVLVINRARQSSPRLVVRNGSTRHSLHGL